MKQKIIIKVHITSDPCRSKAMQLAAAAYGVESVALSRQEREQLVVVGEDVDSTCLTLMLRKKVGDAHILQLSAMTNEKPPTRQAEATPPPAPACPPCRPAVVVYEDYGSPRSSYGGCWPLM